MKQKKPKVLDVRGLKKDKTILIDIYSYKDIEKAIELTAKRIFSVIEKLGVFTYLTGTNEKMFNFNPSEPTWKKLQEGYYERK